MIIALNDKELSRREILVILEISHRTTFRESYLNPTIKNGLVEMTIPDKPRSKNQKYRLTEKGNGIFKLLKKM